MSPDSTISVASLSPVGISPTCVLSLPWGMNACPLVAGIHSLGLIPVFSQVTPFVLAGNRTASAIAGSLASIEASLRDFPSESWSMAAEGILQRDQCEQVAGLPIAWVSLDVGALVDSDALNLEGEALREAGRRTIRSGAFEASDELFHVHLRGGLADADGLGAITDEEECLRTLVLYGSALERVISAVAWIRQARGPARPFHLEINLAQSEVQTTPTDHAFWIRELKRRGIAVSAFSPAIPGVAPGGDPQVGAQDVTAHARIGGLSGHKLGLSLHTAGAVGCRTISGQSCCSIHVKTGTLGWAAGLELAGRLDRRLMETLSLEIQRYLCFLELPDQVTANLKALVEAGQWDHPELGLVLPVFFDSDPHPQLGGDAGNARRHLRELLQRHGELWSSAVLSKIQTCDFQS